MEEQETGDGSYHNRVRQHREKDHFSKEKTHWIRIGKGTIRVDLQSRMFPKQHIEIY